MFETTFTSQFTFVTYVFPNSIENIEKQILYRAGVNDGFSGGV